MGELVHCRILYEPCALLTFEYGNGSSAGVIRLFAIQDLPGRRVDRSRSRAHGR